MGFWCALGLLVALAWPATAQAQAVYRDRVDYLINTMLYAHHNDDREDAAEDLGKIGDPRAISALEQAAAYDTNGGVRKEAFKALKKINASRRVVVAQTPAVACVPQTQPAQQVVEVPPPQPAPAPPPVYAAPPPPVVVVPPPPVVVAPPPPVYIAPAPVIVRPYYPYYYPGPVIVPAPVYGGPHVGGFFSFSFRGSHYSHHH